ELLGAIVIPGLVMLSLFVMPFLGRWRLGHRFNVGLLLILLVGVGLLTGAALNEDYRAVWTDKSKFAPLPEIIEQVGTDDQKITAHFQNDAAKIQRFRDDVIAFEKYKKSHDYL